jgi:hypothetical protein
VNWNIQIAQAALTVLLGLVSLWTAKVVADIKLWIMAQDKQAREDAERKYMSKELCASFQAAGACRFRRRPRPQNTAAEEEPCINQAR